MDSHFNQKSTKKHTIKLQQKQSSDLLRKFLNQNKHQLVKNIDLEKLKATVVPDTPQYLPLLGEMIRNGQLVGFPTQTVYGLGADATNQNALLQIYRVKRRPLSDPIIVHVLNYEQASKLVIPQSQQQAKLFKLLTTQYWPGPLTVILKANLDVLPLVVTAQTGFVGLRSPKCKYARSLIESSKKPIGAPSANLFSHVSPTSAVHVFNDFYDQNITIVDGQKCEYGVESTVVKIVEGNLQVLRQGSLSTKKLKQFVQKQLGENTNVTTKKRIQKQDQNKNMQAPGQLLKHYAPYLPCFSVNLEKLDKSQRFKLKDYTRNQDVDFKQLAFISFSPNFDKFRQTFKFYFTSNELDQVQLSNQFNEQDEKFCTVQQKTKMRSLYFFLRKAQNLEVKVILIGWDQLKQGTLWDKIFRSTQGYQAQIF